MKKFLATAALIAALVQSASAITFPTLTTIYVAAGVYDDGGAANTGAATSVHCSNVSGQSAQVRILVLNDFGGVAGSHTRSLVHGETQTFSTHDTEFSDQLLNTGSVIQGAVNVEATQSAVFCSGMIVDAASPQDGVALHLVRANGHPGTVE